MNVSRITDRISYIGCNDRTTDLFEGLWPLPNGVCYNSYLVKGSEKTAIIDGVELSCALDQIAHIEALLGGKAPDYLVINHMEPDHSGAISILRGRWPDLTVVGNAKTLPMVEGFQGEAGATVQVADGDSLSLGDVTLRFFLTPMVHWPETMVTYAEEEKTLFTGDAFGCFGALNGGVVDTEMDVSRYFPEMVRYYACIVGKYGQFVQRAIDKLKDIPLSFVCPTHGPVWSERFCTVLGIYNALSRYQPLDQGALVVYGSMYGNTERMAEAAARGLAEAGVKQIDLFDASRTHKGRLLESAFRHRALVVASPTYNNGAYPPVAEFLRAIADRGLKNREVLLLGSHTWSPVSIKAMEAILASICTDFALPSIMGRQNPAAEILEACRQAGHALGERLNEPKA